MTHGFEDVFGKGKVLIGVIHLGPLPGSPGYEGNLEGVVGTAIEEARILAKSGFDGIIVENYGDIPFLSDSVAPETTAAMAVAASEIKRVATVPVGINVLRNDAAAALAVAGVCGCEFVRVNVLVGAYVTSEGMLEGQPGKVMRLRRSIAPNALVFADTMVKHAYPLAPTSLAEDVLDVVERGRADAVIVTGPRTGLPPAGDDLESVRTTLKAAGLAVPVLVGSGAGPANAEDFLRLTDGLIVGSYIRKGGRAGGEIDAEKALEMGEIKKRFGQ
jgi:membrane complex biogenesis BtpA family protein